MHFRRRTGYEVPEKNPEEVGYPGRETKAPRKTPEKVGYPGRETKVPRKTPEKVGYPGGESKVPRKTPEKVGIPGNWDRGTGPGTALGCRQHWTVPSVRARGAMKAMLAMKVILGGSLVLGRGSINSHFFTVLVRLRHPAHCCPR